MKRYSTLPVTLYRFQSKIGLQFRQKSSQELLGRFAFDFILGHNKLYNPIEGDAFKTPNGLSFRPLGVNLIEYFETFRGQCIIELPKDLILPDHFVMIHEHTDHYSLQTKQSIQPSEFCRLADNLFKSQKILTKAELNEKVRQYFKK